MNTLGGGTADNDQRIVDGGGSDADAASSVVGFLEAYAAGDKEQPFFLVASLVNPHDIFVFPNSYEAAGYSPDDIAGEDLADIDLPASFWLDDLATKPAAQKGYLAALSSAAHAIPGIGWDFDAQQDVGRARDYVRFYAMLNKLADQHTGAILDALSRLGLEEDTLVVRLADHGELGMAHGGLRQKMLTMYQEAISVPLIFAHPSLPKRGVVCEEPVNHADIAPTLASLAGLDAATLATFGWQGKDLSPLLLNPEARGLVHPYGVIFSYTPNNQAGSPTNILGITDGRIKYAVYFGLDANGQATSPQYELYDLEADPDELDNLLFAAPAARALKLAATWRSRLDDALSKTGGTPAGWAAIPAWKPWSTIETGG